MADDSGTNNAMAPPPPMPPSVTSVARGGGGWSRTTPARQICLPAAASCGEFTPPSRIVRVQPGTRSSAISSLSASHEAHGASAASSTPINPMDAFASSDSSDDDAPSPKKALPDFTTRKSDDDSVASGDDSAGWEAEEDRVLNAFAIQTVAEDALDDIFVDDGPMKEIHEFMLIAGRGVDGEEEGNADGAAEVEPTTTTAVEYETRRVVLQTTNVKMLKAIAVMVNVSTNGKKQLLFNRIRDSSAVS